MLPEAIAEATHVFTSENIIAGVNQSLARMNTDFLDIVQFHSSPSKDAIDKHGALDALRDLQKQRARYG